MGIFFFPKNLLYLRIKFNKLVKNIEMYIFMILFQEIYKYNFKQTHPKFTTTKYRDKKYNNTLIYRNM